MIGGVLRGVGITFIACHEFHSVAVAGERKRGKERGRERERERESQSQSLLFPDGGELFTWGKSGPHLGYELPDSVTKQLRPKKVDALAEQKVINVSCGESHTLGKD